jgi:membrane protease subunit HflC
LIDRTKYLIMGLVVVGVLAYMTTFSVRFTEVAVVTTFGSADEGSVRREPGLGFRLPYPIQSVIKYDTRVRMIETLPETKVTKDERQLIVQAYVQWRVSDPLKFYRAYGNGPAGPESSFHFDKASEFLRGGLRSALVQISRYRMDELLNAGGASRLEQIESDILAQLRGAAGDASTGMADKGIEPLGVGIVAIRLPDAVSKTVFEQQKSEREQVAARTLNEGRTQADTIRQTAEADAQKIMAFAEQLAKIIRSEGDREAAQYYARQKDDKNGAELAVFLKSLEFMAEMVSKQTTLVVPLSTPGFGQFRLDALQRAGGQVPPFAPATAPAASGAGAATRSGGAGAEGAR